MSWYMNQSNVSHIDLLKPLLIGQNQRKQPEPSRTTHLEPSAQTKSETKVQEQKEHKSKRRNKSPKHSSKKQTTEDNFI